MASIDDLDGMNIKTSRQLRKAGIRTTEGLIKRAATRKQRAEMAELLEVTPEQILSWVNRADLLRIRGIGAEYANLLAVVGVRTLGELKRRSAKTLAGRIIEVNEKKRLVHRLPTEPMVEAWIEGATKLESVVRS